MEASVTVLALVLMLAATVFWIWALVDVVRRPETGYRRGSQVLWVVLIALTHSLGALAYLLLGRPRAVTTAGTAGR
ncbi:MAG TPA: PLDc N-terminal domain-containing protein [Acidimicrobiales bacterium]|nr:PLDc N-terminal domain-containing protein [Acidimicrobiales bacterium]